MYATQHSDGSIEIPQAGKKPGTPIQNDGLHWYAPGPVSKAYVMDDSPISGIMGPFGSGKSVTTVMKLLMNCRKQPKGPDGWVRRRTAIIRNTYPELRTTTMNTFFQWVPKHMGRWRDAGPPMLHIQDLAAKVDWEIYFVALDRPDDVKKLLGMELSDAWLNEAREIPKAVLDALTGRIGRYPAVWQGGCYRAQILCDTNPPDTDHWWYTLAEHDSSDEKKRQVLDSMKEAEERLRSLGHLGATQKLFSFFRQPSGRSVHAENLRNLKGGYYELLMAGKDDDWIKVYVDGDYGFVMDGKPVYPEYKDSTHCADFDLIRGIGIRLGFDFGLTPAAIISQRAGNGRWFDHDELTTERIGVVSFAEELKRHLAEKYPGIPIVSARGDPSGEAMNPDERTCFQILKAAGFKTAEPAPTNDPVRRREAVAYLLRTNIDGKPGLLVHRRCSVLRKGYAGGYHYRRLQVQGEARYREVPEKNKYSHPCEADQYDKLSAGEDRNVTLSIEHRSGKRQTVADSEYDILGGNG